MSLRKKLIIIGASLGLAALASSPVFGQGAKTNSNPENEKIVAENKEKDLQISLGISRSYPKLSAVNKEIKGIENQLRQVAPKIEKFQTWKDVYTGVLELRIEKNVKEGFSEGISLCYGKGEVKTSDNPRTIFQIPMSVDFSQQYETFFITPFVSYKWDKKVLGFTPKMYAGPNFTFLNADTSFNYNIPYIVGRKADMKYKGNTIGKLVGIVFEKQGKTNIALELQYNWTTLTGKSNVKDSMLGNYKKDTEIDFSGPSIKILFSKEF